MVRSSTFLTISTWVPPIQVPIFQQFYSPSFASAFARHRTWRRDCVELAVNTTTILYYFGSSKCKLVRPRRYACKTPLFMSMLGTMALVLFAVLVPGWIESISPLTDKHPFSTPLSKDAMPISITPFLFSAVFSYTCR